MSDDYLTRIEQLFFGSLPYASKECFDAWVKGEPQASLIQQRIHPLEMFARCWDQYEIEQRNGAKRAKSVTISEQP